MPYEKKLKCREYKNISYILWLCPWILDMQREEKISTKILFLSLSLLEVKLVKKRNWNINYILSFKLSYLQYLKIIIWKVTCYQIIGFVLINQQYYTSVNDVII